MNAHICGTGLKKCIPTTLEADSKLSGSVADFPLACPAAAASFVSEIELVLDPRIVGAGRIEARLRRRASFKAGISGIAYSVRFPFYRNLGGEHTSITRSVSLLNPEFPLIKSPSTPVILLIASSPSLAVIRFFSTSLLKRAESLFNAEERTRGEGSWSVNGTRA